MKKPETANDPNRESGRGRDTVAQIVLAIRQEILTGELRHGQMAPTARALGDRFDASRSTIEQALYELEAAGLLLRKPNCRPVIQTPLPIDFALPRPPAKSIAAALWITTNEPGGGPILRGIQRGAPGYQTYLANLPGNNWEALIAAEGAFLLNLAHDRNALGLVIWYLGGERNIQPLQAVRDAGIPIVFVDRLPDGFDGDLVATDNENSAADVVRHLIELGHRRIGYLTNSESVSSVRERLAGYRIALEEAGIPCRPEDVFELNPTSPPDTPRHFDAVFRYFRELPEPVTAFFTVNDLAAIDLYAAIVRQGFRVPEDYSVAGFDGALEWMPNGGYLTTAWQDFERIGLLAGRLVLQRIADGAPGHFRHILAPAPLRPRGSTAPPKGE